jgi:hypothetical protein
MNEYRPYDQSLRDKLSRLPTPDPQKSWPEMRRLLDEEMPEGSGYSKRRGGWWLFGSVLIFIIAASSTIVTLNFSKQNADPPLSAAKNASPPQMAARSGSTDKTGIQQFSEKPGVIDDKILLRKKLVTGTKTHDDRTKDLPDRLSQAGGSQNKSVRDGVNQAGDKVSANGHKDEASGDDHRRMNNKEIAANNVATNNIAANKAAANNTATNNIAANNTATNDIAANNVATKSIAANKVAISDNAGDNIPVDDIAVFDAASIGGIEFFPVTSYAGLIDSIDDRSVMQISYTPVSRKYWRQNKKYGKPVNIRVPYTTAGRKFAIGLSLPLAFPLGDQKAFGYNVNGGPNTASDYIPAPHVQLHFSSKSYIQSELQFMSPQFIRPVLLYQSQYRTPVSNTTSSVYARKLYYFNVPVSVHYSPFRNFYMGTGLQFSSLLSGVAMREQIRTGMVSSDSIYNVSYSKFSNDSLSHRLNSNEMRLMLDANYYWNRFTVGLRYNQALSDYVSTRVAPAIPYTVDKNKSLQFYMRYNLWEDKKRKTNGGKMLTFK